MRKCPRANEVKYLNTPVHKTGKNVQAEENESVNGYVYVDTQTKYYPYNHIKDNKCLKYILYMNTKYHTCNCL